MGSKVDNRERIGAILKAFKAGPFFINWRNRIKRNPDPRNYSPNQIFTIQL